MRLPTPLLRALVLGPQLLLSAAIVLVLMAVLPPALAWLVLAAAVVVLSGVASGVLEGSAVRLLYGARPAQDGEQRLVVDAVSRTRGVADRRVEVYVRGRHSLHEDDAFELVGRRYVVVAPALVDAMSSGLVPDVVVDELVARATSRAEVDAANAIWVQVATLPYRLVAAVARWPLTRLRSMPLGVMAWRLRGMLLLGVLAPSSSSPRGAATASAAAIAVSYLVPMVEHKLQVRRTAQQLRRLVALLTQSR